MAATSIWAVKGWLGRVVIYAENPDKTENPAYFEKPGMTAEQAQGLSDVIAYAAQNEKTGLSDEHTEIKRHFVTGINCHADTARDEMMAVKSHFGKTDGVIAYHGYQSFAPGEATPELAHEIGVKLAERLWGDRYQVLVTTHLDKAHHIHNHVVLNNVSMVDGKKYHRTEQDYRRMQKESDTLCREYGLSVIENPQRGQSKQYAEWQAERDGNPTWRGLVKSDVDTAIRQAMTESQFWHNLKKMGYEVKVGKDISVRPPGKERFVRLRRNFGDEYELEAIRRRILSQSKPNRTIIPANPPPPKMRIVGTFHKAQRMTGFRALYFYYLYKIGVLPRKREQRPSGKQVYFLFREDIRHMQNISREARLLVAHGIDTQEQLTVYKESLTGQMAVLSEQRKRLHRLARKTADSPYKEEIAALSAQMLNLRREVRLCEDIEMRSGVMTDKLRKAQETQKSDRKEIANHESFRGRR